MTESKEICPFCALPENRIITSADHWLVVRDGYPISPGHTLLVPKRHVKSLCDLSSEEQSDFFPLLNQTRDTIQAEFQPDAFNIGVNDGVMAGQTVSHLHIHLIPRYKGDTDDPRGGIRWIIPDKAKYWSD